MSAEILDNDMKITVCDKCLMACCWQGVFYCDDYRTAGTTEKTISELKTLKLESSDYWCKARSL